MTISSESKPKSLDELDDFDKMLLFQEWFSKFTRIQQRNILRMLIHIGIPDEKGSGFN